MYRINKKLVTIGFSFIIILISLISVLLPEKSYSESENRYLRTAPEFSLKSLLNGTFGEKYELYLSDQFLLRNSFIGLKVMFERMELKTDINNVYIGKDEYLIEKFEREDIEGERLDLNISKTAEFINAMSSRLGTEHVRLMPVFSASEIMTAKLPLAAAPYSQRNVYKMFLDAVGPDVLIDVYPVLKAHENDNIYYRTDHHWTTLGAYYGYSAWASSVKAEYKDIKDYNIKTVSDTFLGTIHSKLNITVRPDAIQIFETENTPDVKVYFDGSTEAKDTLYYPSHLDTKDKYSMFLDGNHGLAEIRNIDACDAAKGKSIAIIKDSFANCIAPFYIDNYETVYMIDLRYFNVSVSEFTAQHNVDDILVLYNIPGFATEQSIGKLR